MSFKTCDKSSIEIETGSLRNTTSGKIEYRFSYTNEEGIPRRKSVTGERIDECIARAEDFIQGIELAKYEMDPDISMSEILRRAYLMDYELGYVREQGYCRNLSNLKILEKSNISRIPIRAVTKSDIRLYLLSLSKYSKSMVSKFYMQIKLAFFIAEMDHIIDHNFMKHRDMKCPKIGKPERKVPALTPEQQKLFVEYLENTKPKGGNDYRIQLMIELYSGMRMGEINALRREDIDFSQNVVHVRRTVSRGLDYREFISENTKTDAGRRDVPISMKLKIYLQEALARQKDNREELIFYDYRKNSIISTSQVNNYYSRVCESIGIPVFGQHALRHTFATRCIESGCDPKTVSVLLGHSSVNITLNLYVHPGESSKRSVIDRMIRSVR